MNRLCMGLCLMLWMTSCVSNTKSQRQLRTSHDQTTTTKNQRSSFLKVAKPSFESNRLGISYDGFCQVMKNGTIRCRQLNISPSAIHEKPPNGQFKQIVGYSRGFCALSTKNKVVCWGNTDSYFLPKIGFDAQKSFTQLVSTKSTVCALSVDGELYCARPNSSKFTQNPPSSMAVKLPGKNYTRLSAFPQYICALETHRASCFFLAQTHLPDKTTTFDLQQIKSSKIVLTYPRAPWVKALRNRHGSCALAADGHVRCSSFYWARKEMKKKGDNRPLAPELFKGGQFEDLITSRAGFCAKRVNGPWLCEHGVVIPQNVSPVAYDLNHSGKLRGQTSLIGLSAGGTFVADGIWWTRKLQLKNHRQGFVGLTKNFDYKVCALRQDDSVYCFDFYNYDDDFLNNVSSMELTPYGFETDKGKFALPGRGFYTPEQRASIVPKRARTFVKHYGKGVHPQFEHRLKPAQERKFSDVQYSSNYGHFSCGLKLNGLMSCWGQITGSSRKVRPPKVKVERFALGGVFACGLTPKNHALKCWGSDYYGFLRHAPKGDGFSDLRTTYLNACARRKDGKVVCWGQGFGETFVTPFAPESFTLGSSGVCGLHKETKKIQCWGIGVVWQQGRAL